MSELYDHIHEDRSEERPTASVWYNDDTRVKTFEIEDAHTLHPGTPIGKPREYKSSREARGTTDAELIARNNAVRTEPWLMGGRRPQR
jgi:hypothetical protein